MLSLYAESLPVDAKKRYREKLSDISGVDPFTLQAGKRSGPLEAAESLPQVDATDLVSYLVLQTLSQQSNSSLTNPSKLTTNLSVDGSRK